MSAVEQDEDVFEDAVEEPESPVAVLAAEPLSAEKNNNLLRKLKLPKSRSPRSKREGGEIPLGEALEEAKLAVDLFLNNQFNDAKNICQPLADRSIYHAIGYGVFMHLKAVMTFEEKHIEEASAVLNAACDTIGGFRRRTGFTESVGRMLRKADYDSYTEMELHAELCYAECLLLKASLTFCEDETLVSFVKAGLKVRTCYQIIRDCWCALQQRDWSTSAHKNDFESGVRFGVGVFSFMISLMPARVMKLLEFIGFSGNRNEKEAGLREIMWAYEQKDGMRQFLATFVLLAYHLILSYFVGSAESDLDLCKKILDEKMKKYPNGAFFQFFNGRYHFVQGEVEEAIVWYRRSVESQDDWPQFHHICYWELFWANTFCQNWRESMRYSTLLFEESKWSKCIYAYQRASAMAMFQNELTEDQRKEQIELMRSIPGWKQRIAGKSLPMEKFAIRKASRFVEQGNRLVLPALELVYAWNGFKIMQRKYRLLERMYVLIEKELREIQSTKESNRYYNDDLCLLQLLNAMCLKHMSSPLQAEESLKTVISYSGQLKADTYLIPYALFEYAMLLKDQGLTEAAMEHLESAKNDFKDYSLQSRLHFRIHAAQTDIRAAAKAKAKAESGLNRSASQPSSPTLELTVDDILPMAEDAVSQQRAQQILAGGR